MTSFKAQLLAHVRSKVQLWNEGEAQLLAQVRSKEQRWNEGERGLSLRGAQRQNNLAFPLTLKTAFAHIFRKYDPSSGSHLQVGHLFSPHTPKAITAHA